VLSSIVLLLCLAASVAAAGILVVLFGPLPVRRRITMVSRIQPMPMAAGPVAMPGMPIFDPSQATFTPAHALPVIPHPIAAAVEPPRRAKPVAPIAPLQLRRPRTMPSPLARTRSARGTEPRPHHGFDVEHTAADAPMFELDDPTFLEDDRS